MTMARGFLFVQVLIAIFFLLVLPAEASLVLSGAALTPDGPLVPGEQVQIAATYTIIPSGSATFARGHSLQMQTTLDRQQWTIQVMLDGMNAARQTATGSTAFVNGEILSYPTTRDVGFVVTLDGYVPQAATFGTAPVLTVEELDNNGNPVPGSFIAFSPPVAAPPGLPAFSPVATLIPPAPATPQPGTLPGSALSPVLAAVAASLAILAVSRKR